MSTKDWIKERLKETNCNSEVVQSGEYYQRFLQETGSEASKESYNRAVRQARQELKIEEGYVENNSEEEKDDKQEKEEGEVKYASYDKKELEGILEKEIQSRQTKIDLDTLKEIAHNNGIPYEAFLFKIPDIDKVLKQIYKVNLFHIENDKTIDKLKKDKSIAEKELKYYKESSQRDDELIKAINEVAKIYEPFKFQFKLNKDKKHERTLVALLSDWHYDEIVNEEQMHGVNKYNIEVAQYRIDNYFRGIIRNGQELGASSLYLKILGDMISGDLHDLAENSELGSIKSIIQLADYIAQHIRYLTKYFKKIDILGLVGNHSRTTKKPQFKNKQQKNYEYLLYEFIKREVRDIASFEIPESYFKINTVYGVNFLSLHGDTIRGGNGLNSIPGNLSRDISLLSGTLGKADLSFDYVDIAHFHSSNITKSFSGAKIIMNGSLIGPNEFSLGALKKGDTPSQYTYIVEDTGRVRYYDEIDVV